jgi:hypothetical protein
MGAISSVLKAASSKYGIVAVTAYSGASELKNREPGKSAVGIVAKTAAEMAMWYAIPVVGQVVLGAELLYSVASLANQIHAKNSSYIRTARQSFSHSFTHTDATYQAQQRGIAMIGKHNGLLGSEAGMMASLYSRR